MSASDHTRYCSNTQLKQNQFPRAIVLRDWKTCQLVSRQQLDQALSGLGRMPTRGIPALFFPENKLILQLFNYVCRFTSVCVCVCVRARVCGVCMHVGLQTAKLCTCTYQ